MSKADVAVRAAQGELGKDYEAHRDCSGFTAWCAAQAGVTIPQGSVAQFQVGRSIPRDQVAAGDLVFWGDLDHNLYAFDAASGKVLWQTKLNGPIQNSTITYAVNGKQYLAVLTGVGAVTSSLIQQSGIKPNVTYNSLSVFALP